MISLSVREREREREMRSDYGLCCCCVGWLFGMAVIGGIIYGFVFFILSTTQRGGEFSLDSAAIESMNLSDRKKIEIVMKLEMASYNPNSISGNIKYDSLDFLLFFDSFNLAKSLTVEPFRQTHRNHTHFSATLYADSSQQPMPNETFEALQSSIHSGNISLHLHINIDGRLFGRWKKCSLKSDDDCYFSLPLTHIGANGTGGSLDNICKWTSGCD